jgi:hypothetical protein
MKKQFQQASAHNRKKEKETIQKIGQRILSEANDLKRTFNSICQELNLDISSFNQIMSGEATYVQTLELAQTLSSNYPVKLSDLMLDIPDHENGIKIVRQKESVDSKRVFSRLNKDNERSPYYEYRDTATAKLSPFKPEWIKELRVVDNNNPDNPDVAYNNGHFLHQMTAFIGPVNFYWEIGGKKYSKEMNTGSSNYITPFISHSFASRDASKSAIIIAVTFSSDAGRARSELYSLGSSRIDSFVLNNRTPSQAISKLIHQILDDQCLTHLNLKDLIESKNIQLTADELLDSNTQKSSEDLKKLAEVLNVMPSIFELPSHTKDNEVELKDRNTIDAYVYNSNILNPDYIINPLAGNKRLPLVNSFDFNIKSKTSQESSVLRTSLHSYIFNYGKESVNFWWSHDGVEHNQVIDPDDSIYIEPFIDHKFFNVADGNARMFIFRVGGEVTLSVQKEISSFARSDRIIETMTWFN